MNAVAPWTNNCPVSSKAAKTAISMQLSEVIKINQIAAKAYHGENLRQNI